MNRQTPLLVLFAAFALGLSACEATELQDARLKDTPAAYEAFLQQHPDSAEAGALHQRIDELRFAAANKAGTAAALQEYLYLHPQGTSRAAALVAEEELAFSEAAAANTAEAVATYLSTHPKGASVKDANSLLDRLLYRERIGVQKVRIEKINMANNADGPLDGWAVLADVVNEGHRTVSLVEVHVDLLDPAGKAAGPKNKWWAVAPDLGGFPTPETMKPVLAPGDSRAFRWTTAAVPENWSQEVRLRVSEVRFED